MNIQNIAEMKKYKGWKIKLKKSTVKEKIQRDGKERKGNYRTSLGGLIWDKSFREKKEK